MMLCFILAPPTPPPSGGVTEYNVGNVSPTFPPPPDHTQDWIPATYIEKGEYLITIYTRGIQI